MGLKTDHRNSNVIAVKDLNRSRHGNRINYLKTKEKQFCHFPYLVNDIKGEDLHCPDAKSGSKNKWWNSKGRNTFNCPLNHSFSWPGSLGQATKRKKSAHLKGGNHLVHRRKRNFTVRLKPIVHKDLDNLIEDNKLQNANASNDLKTSLSRTMTLPPIQRPLDGVGEASGVRLRRRRSQSFDATMLLTHPDKQEYLKALNKSDRHTQAFELNEGTKMNRKSMASPRGSLLEQIYNHLYRETDNSQLATQDRVKQHLQKTVIEKGVKGHIHGQVEGQTDITCHQLERARVSRASRPDSRTSTATSSIVAPSTTDSSQTRLLRMNTMSSCSRLISSRHQEKHRAPRQYPSTDVAAKKSKISPRNMKQSSPSYLSNQHTCRFSGSRDEHLCSVLKPTSDSSTRPKTKTDRFVSTDYRPSDVRTPKSHGTPRGCVQTELVTRCQEWLKGLPDKFSGLSTVLSKPD